MLNPTVTLVGVIAGFAALEAVRRRFWPDEGARLAILFTMWFGVQLLPRGPGTPGMLRLCYDALTFYVGWPEVMMVVELLRMLFRR